LASYSTPKLYMSQCCKKTAYDPVLQSINVRSVGLIEQSDALGFQTQMTSSSYTSGSFDHDASSVTCTTLRKGIAKTQL